MRDLTTLKFHPTKEKIVSLLCEKTQNTNPKFFRMMVCYYICKMAATMRITVTTKDRGEIPVNFYGVNLGISGIGKGHSTNILEEQIIQKFRTVFFENSLPNIAEKSLRELAIKRMNIHNSTIGSQSNTPLMEFDESLATVRSEYESLGKLAFSFDSGTTAAVKQMRHKLLMAGCGAVNMEIDEIGSNLLGNVDVLTTCLELFDMGKVKQKLTKNTKENTRSEEIEGKTPANLMLFGTPSKLFDGAKVEEEFRSFLQTGYGRRCFFGYAKKASRDTKLTATDIYNKLTNKASSQLIDDISNMFAALAAEINFQKKIEVSKEVSLILIEYRMHCDDIADRLGDHEEERKAELSHRYFKALKLAGGFAFIDNHSHITEDNLYHAIAMAEESGRAFNDMLNQDKPYVKLAKYIAGIGREVTHVDLTESLPFYKGSAAQKLDIMNLAVAWGYSNSVIIKRKFDNNIEFIRGETLKETNLDEMYLSHSNDIAVAYKNVRAPWNRLPELVKMKDYHWCNHHTSTGQRIEGNMTPGFNMIVLDVDDGVKISLFQSLMKQYSYIVHTTKRHTEQNHRFRVLIPLNYILKLGEDDFKEFMDNIYEWLPFEADTATGQRSRKWATTDGTKIFTNVGETLNALLFIPRTSKNEERQQQMLTCQSMTGMERWFMSNISSGNRNNQLLKYGLVLVDSGYNLVDIGVKVEALNQKLDRPLSTDEIHRTVMKTVQKKHNLAGGY